MDKYTNFGVVWPHFCFLGVLYILLRIVFVVLVVVSLVQFVRINVKAIRTGYTPRTAAAILLYASLVAVNVPGQLYAVRSTFSYFWCSVATCRQIIPEQKWITDDALFVMNPIHLCTEGSATAMLTMACVVWLLHTVFRAGK